MAASSHVLLAGWFAPTAWVLLWVALTAATVALVALLRTKWAAARPWKKCALLSFWVHVLLACLAATIRIATSGGPGIGPGSGGPIRIAFISVESPSEKDDTTAPPQGEPTSALPPAPPVAVVKPEPEKPKGEPVVVAASAPADGAKADAAPLEAPALLPQPKPPKPKRDKPAEVATAKGKKKDQAPPATDVKPNKALDAAEVVAEDSAAPTQGAPDGEPGANGSRTGVPAAYAKRFAADRDAMVAGGGGNPATERAVRAALAWLAKSQGADGRWDPARYGAGQERYILGQDRGGAGAKADTGISGLALLAFLGAGHTHHEGPYATHVDRGLDYLRRTQAADGSLAGNAEMFARMYCHSMATFAVSEAYAMTRDESLEPWARAAVGYSLAVQHPVDGGWRYRPGDTGDTSQLGWQLMALKSAELGGVVIPEVTWTRADRFLRSVRRGSGGGGGLAAYRPEGPPTRTMTAEALYCRQLLTGRADGGLDQAALAEAIESLSNEAPSANGVNLYYWYYATLALHHAQGASEESAEAWRRWNDAMTRTLVASQDDDGSWPAICLWGGYGGRVYTTALGAMCLEAYYRYSPAGEGVGLDVARRDEWQAVPSR